MKKNIAYYMMMTATALGEELTPVEQKMLTQFLRGDESAAK